MSPRRKPKSAGRPIAKLRSWRASILRSPCPTCNPSDRDHPPCLPPGFRPDIAGEPADNDAILGSIQRVAMCVIEAPPGEREALYQTIRDSLRETLLLFPIGPEFEEQYMTWLRSLVAIIESGGGAKGGTA